MKIHNFLHNVNSVTDSKYKCSGFLFCVCGLISLSSWLSSWFLICRWVQVLFLSLAVNFQIFNSHFPVTTLGLYLFSGACLNMLLFLRCAVIENSSF